MGGGNKGRGDKRTGDKMRDERRGGIMGGDERRKPGKRRRGDKMRQYNNYISIVYSL